MKAKTPGRQTETAFERFQKFGKALMAVPKKELDKELAKHERKKKPRRSGAKISD